MKPEAIITSQEEPRKIDEESDLSPVENGDIENVESGAEQSGEESGDTAQKRGEAIVEMAQVSAQPVEVDPTTPEAPATPEIDSKAEAQRFIRRYGQLLSLFSRDSSLRFELDESIDTFAFDAKSFKVHVPLEWFASGEYSEHELLFANYHERAHFIDMRENPEAYLGSFEHCQEKAKKLAADYLRAHPGKASKEAVERFFYNEMHTFYNCLDDIYVNDMVKKRVALFDEGDGADDIISLYKKLNYEDPDLTKMPLHRQFVISLLRDSMVGKELGMSVVDERVEKALSTKRMGLTIRGQVETKLKTRSGAACDPAERYKLIKTIIEPIYLQLLQEALDDKEKEDQEKQEKQDGEQGEQGEQSDDKRDGEQNNQGEQGDGEQDGEQSDGEQDGGQTGDKQDDEQQGENNGQQNSGSKRQDGGEQKKGGGGSDFDPFGDNDENSPSKRFRDALDKGDSQEEVIKEILEEFADKDKEDKMSPQERAKHQAEKRKKYFDQEHNITPQEREQNDNICAEIAGARRDMRKFWESIIGKSLNLNPVRVGEQRRGRLDVGSFIRRYPEVVEAERNQDLRSLSVYERTVLEHELVDSPERIEVSLVVDCSGSMGGAGEDAARRTAALLMYSLKDFNDELERTRSRTHSVLKTDSQVIVFGSTAKEVKPFAKGKGNAQADADIIKSISTIDSSLGGTNDEEALLMIRDGVTGEQKKRIGEKKLKKIVFVITDGESQDPFASRAVMEELAGEGIIMVGFQIGGQSEVFDRTWRGDESGKGTIKGINAGDDIRRLPKRLMDELGDLLGNITI